MSDFRLKGSPPGDGVPVSPLDVLWDSVVYFSSNCTGMVLL